MAEANIQLTGTKEERYQQLLPMIHSLIEGETDKVANMANFVAALRQGFHFFWVGFYLVKENELVLGPFQGPIACTRIQFGKGVCGTAWKEQKTQLVPNVDEFPGHIACSSDSKSEIVVPLIKNGQVMAVLDVDSDQLNDFDSIDEQYLNDLCAWFSDFL
jgi:L-methionine (R)-S-oxide reductase